MKAQILKIAGVKSEKEFYKKFPTEAAFLKKHGKQLAKLKKAQVGTIKNPDVIDGNELLENAREDVLSPFESMKERSLELGVDSLTTEEDKEDIEYKAKIDALYANAMNQKKDDGLMSKLSRAGELAGAFGDIFGGGGGAEGSVEVGDLEMLGFGKKGGKFKPHMMYDPKTGKGYKANKLADHLRMDKKGYTHKKPKKAQDSAVVFPDLGFEIPEQPQYGNPDGSGLFGKSYSTASYNEDGTPVNFGQKTADFLQNDLGKILNDPISKDIMMGIKKLGTQKDELKDLKQMKEVSAVLRQAALSQPEIPEREYVRPEDVMNTGEEFFPIYGVGTNVLAKNGQTMNMFANPGYAPLNNTSKVKSFQNGGNADAWGKVFDIGGNMLYGDKASRDAGSNIGGGIGRGIGTLIGGPLGGAIGDFVGSGIGGVLDTNDNKQELARSTIDSNVSDMTYNKLGAGIRANYASYMKKGGKLPGPNNDYGMIGAPGPQILKTFDGKNLNNMLQKASRMPDTLKEGGSVAGKGNVKTLWGGDVGAVAYNPYAGGDSMYFDGNSHEKKDVKTGETGIGVAYGPQSVSMNEPVVEVEGGEPAQILNENGQENLVIYGDLKIPKGLGEVINDQEAEGKKFKQYVNNLNDEEARINKQMGKAVEHAGDAENTKWGQLLLSTSDAIINGGDMKLQDIANKKVLLADLQEALNDTFKEKGIDGNSFITKGEIKAVKDTEDYAKNGGKMETYTDYAEDGTKVKKLRKIEKELHKASKMHKSQAERIGKMVKAEDGAEIPKAQNEERLNLNELPVKFKTKEEAIEAGYEEFPEGSGKFRKVKVEATEEVEGQDAQGSDIGEMPEGQKYDDRTGLAGGVTEADYEKLVKENSWFDWNNFDRRKKEDVKRFQKEFNKRNKDAGIDVSLSVDGIIGKETASARFTPPVDPQDAQDPEYEYAEVEEDVVTTDTTTTLKLRTPFDANLLRRLIDRDIDNDLDYNQILPEMTAASQNQLEPVYAQTFQPRLRQPYDISFQDQRNAVNSQYRALSQNPILAGNPAALAAAQATFFDAKNNINAEEFRQNQAMRDTVYTGNLEAINNADILNMGIYDKQQDRQAKAVANTKATNLEIVKSIADKYQKNKLENRREKVLRELFPNFRFGEDLDLFNQGSAVFNIPGQGPTGTGNPIIDILTGGGINPNAAKQNQNEDESAFDTDRADRKLNQFQRGLKAKAIYDYVYPQNQPMAAKKGMKLTPIKRAKKNQKNSNVVRQFRNMTYNNPLGK